jgi:hypothetical protein
MRETISVRLKGGPFRPPWAKHGEPDEPTPEPEWVKPEWWKPRMADHPYAKWAHRIELESFARTGKIMRASTLARHLAKAVERG